MISESPTYPDERPTVADSSEHANAQRLEKRKVLHDRGPGEPPPPKRLRPTLDTTRLRSRKKVFWALPEELMELICQYLSQHNFYDLLLLSTRSGYKSATRKLQRIFVKYAELCMSKKSAQCLNNTSSLLTHPYNFRAITFDVPLRYELFMATVLPNFKHTPVRAIMFRPNSMVVESVLNQMLLTYQHLPKAELLMIPSHDFGDLTRIQGTHGFMRRLWTFIDPRNKDQRNWIRSHNASVTRNTLIGPHTRAPPGKYLPGNAPPQIRELTGHFGMCIRLTRIAPSTRFDDLKDRPLDLICAPYAPADIVRGMIDSKRQYRVHSVSILNDNYKDNTLMDNVLIRLFEQMPNGVILEELRVAEVNLLLKTGYIPQHAYLVNKIGLLRLYNCPGLSQFTSVDAFRNSDLHTFIYLRDYPKLNPEVRDGVFRNVTRHCSKLEHFCFHARRDISDEQVKTALSAPAANGQIKPVSRKERKKARQSEVYGIGHLLRKLSPILKTLSLRIGERSEVPDQELQLLGQYFPDLRHVGIPCPVLWDAIEVGHLSDDMWRDVGEQATILSTIYGLEYLHLFVANLGTEPRMGTKAISTALQRVAYEVLAIVSSECRGLKYLSITVWDFVEHAGGKSEPVAVHLKVNRDDSKQSELVWAKELGVDMELYGDTKECTYEGIVDTKTARWARPKY
ncbi:hypothetical protein J4E85_004525 [Alternaria conjuncta]|uniref:uncharacterized protein n=1 Tax=Alternaria conjuncta TaxID=181017 RepID=UPI00221EFD0D|nr:uncharacterized protein J4E85_004525 [Alternaria conjuncta]KAI4929904.1 hypothetical protein J4E85_004525 [Alternaria conjuncta]